MENKIKVRVYKTNSSSNLGSGGFKYYAGKAIIIGNNDKLSENLLRHMCMYSGECAYGDLESMECRDQDGGHSYYELVKIFYMDAGKAPHWVKSSIEKHEGHDLDDVNYGEKNHSEMKEIFYELEEFLFIDFGNWEISHQAASNLVEINSIRSFLTPKRKKALLESINKLP